MSLRPNMQLKLQLKCKKLVFVTGKGRFNHYVTLLGLREREEVLLQITTEKQRERVGISYTVTQQQLKKKLNQIK